MSKMGISTLQSYRGAQIFEAIGLKKTFVDQYFTWTPSRIEGVGLDEIAEEVVPRHELAYPKRPVKVDELEAGGQYQWRRDGEHHLFNPQTVAKLQHATRVRPATAIFKEYSTARRRPEPRARDAPRPAWTSTRRRRAGADRRGRAGEEIVKRFATGAMSFGSISSEAHETLAIAMNRIGGRSNTGEGGEDRRATAATPTATGGAARSSRSRRAASASRATTWSTPTSCRSRWRRAPSPARAASSPATRSTSASPRSATRRPASTLISPPPHHDIYSIEDLAQLIHDLKNANPRGADQREAGGRGRRRHGRGRRVPRRTPTWS